MPEVSVIIPCYNHARYVRQAVYSVLSQTFADLELIVVDDGSTDDSLRVLAGISDPRMKVIQQAHQGAHAAINRGLHAAAGKFLSILNSDDFYHPERLEKCSTAARADPNTGLVGSFIQIVDERNRPLGIKHGYRDCEPWLLENPERSFRAAASLKDALLTENYLSTTSNYLFARRWFERVGDFRPLRFTHDWDYALRLARLANLVLIEAPLLSYRVHSRNTIRQDQVAMIFEICWILAVHLPDLAASTDPASQPGPGQRVDQLLHSIYTYNCDRVLSVLLLQNLHEDHAKALDLLSPGNPEREQYLQYIRQIIDASDPGGSGSAPPNPASFLDERLLAFKRWMRRNRPAS